MRSDLATKKFHPIIDLDRQLPPGGGPCVAVAPGDKALIYVQAESDTDIHLVENYR